MGTTLQVDPAALRTAAGTFDAMRSEANQLVQPLNGVPGDVRGLATADACRAAADVVRDSAAQINTRITTLTEGLQKAADVYQQTDSGMADKIGKAGPDGKDGKDGPATNGAPDGKANPGAGPSAIPVSQVTYDKGSWPSGATATRDAVNKALDQRGVTDPAARQRWMTAYMTLTEHESSYNPMAVNNWDTNAKPPHSTYTVSDGSGNGCSRGLAQCVPGTFAQYHQPGTSNNIYDPVANVAASMNYLVDVYHVAPDGSDIQAKVGQTNPGTRQGY